MAVIYFPFREMFFFSLFVPLLIVGTCCYGVSALLQSNQSTLKSTLVLLHARNICYFSIDVAFRSDLVL